MIIHTKQVLFAFLTNFWLKDFRPILTMLGAVGLVSVGLFNQFLFGEKLMLFTDIGSDTYYSYYAVYYFLTTYVSSFHLPLWSFKLGAGSSVLTQYQFLYDPFTVVFYLVGVDNISRAVVWVFVLKIFCAGTFTYIYLRYLGIGHYARIIASLLFAFNGFLMAWGQHFFMATWVVFLPLLLYTIEVWFKTDKKIPLALCVAFMALNIQLFTQVTVFCGLYIIFRLSIEWPKNSATVSFVKLSKFACIYILAIGISAIFWLPEYYLLKSNPRISTDFINAIIVIISNFVHFNSSEYYWTLLSRIFSNNLQGVGSLYTGFQNYYESPQMYVGLLPLIILPQLYSVFSSRAKWLASFALLLAAIFLVFPSFSQIMNGFQYPSYRWDYNVLMLELLLAALVLDAMLMQHKINLPVLIVTGFVLLFCLVAVYLHNHGSDHVANKLAAIKSVEIIAWVVVYCLMLYLLIKTRSKRWVFVVFLLLICGELVLEHRDSFVKRSVFEKGIEQNRDVNFFDYGNLAVKKLKTSDSSFYRIEKNHWILSLNDSVIQSYFGLDSYNSLNNPSYQNFLQKFGYSASSSVIKWNATDLPYLADMLSVKYLLTKNSVDTLQHLKLVEKYGDVSVFKRESFLPLGFTYDSYISLSIINQLSSADRERALIQGAALEEAPPIKLKELLRIAPTEDDDNFRANLKKEVLNLVKMEEDRITGNIHIANDKLLFLSIPFDPGWSAYVNGVESKIHKVNYGFSGLYLNQGDNFVELTYTPPYMKAGAVISILCGIMITLWAIRSKRKLASAERKNEIN